jgi:hypothetical protein
VLIRQDFGKYRPKPKHTMSYANKITKTKIGMHVASFEGKTTVTVIYLDCCNDPELARLMQMPVTAPGAKWIVDAKTVACMCSKRPPKWIQTDALFSWSAKVYQNRLQRV